MNTDNTYKTRDFYLSIVLVALDYKVEEISLDRDKNKATFCFKNSENLQHIVECYWNREVNIEAQMLFQAHRYLKNRLNEAKRKYIGNLENDQ